MQWRRRTRSAPKPKFTVADRLSIGLFSAVSTFVLAALIWWGLAWQLSGPPFPFAAIVGFSIFVGVLGAALRQNLVAELIGGLMHALLGLSKW